MSARDKKDFINELCDSIKETILGNVAKMPATWDGHELRQYIADKFTELSVCGKLDRKTAREYRNTVIVNNL